MRVNLVHSLDQFIYFTRSQFQLLNHNFKPAPYGKERKVRLSSSTLAASQNLLNRCNSNGGMDSNITKAAATIVAGAAAYFVYSRLLSDWCTDTDSNQSDQTPDSSNAATQQTEQSLISQPDCPAPPDAANDDPKAVCTAPPTDGRLPLPSMPPSASAAPQIEQSGFSQQPTESAVKRPGAVSTNHLTVLESGRAAAQEALDGAEG